MMELIYRRLTAWAVAVLCVASTWTSAADADDAARLFPKTTVAYLEFPQPAQLVETVLDHPLKRKIESLDQVQEQLQGEEFKQFQALVTLAEYRLGMDWRKAVESYAGGGIAIGLDAESQGVAMLVRGKDEESMDRFHKTIVDLVKGMAGEGAQEPWTTQEYRGQTVYRVNDVVAAQLGPWALVTNQASLGKAIADRYLDGRQPALSEHATFKQARRESKDAAMWAYVDIQAIRQAQIAPDLFREKLNDLAAEFLFGGIQSTLNKTPYATMAVRLTDQQLTAQVAVPHQSDWLPKAREFYFGPPSEGSPPVALRPQQTIANIVSYRDIGGLWLAKEDLFEENVIAELSQADSNLSTLFSGLDFGEEVLGATQPGFQLVVTRQSYEQVTPAVKLPAFALVLRLKEPERVQRRFKIAFQSAVGLINYESSSQGVPQLDLETERIGDGQLIHTSYLMDDVKDSERINYNFSPSIAFVDDHFIISSTSRLARELVELAQQASSEGPANANTSIDFDFTFLQKILADNQRQLVTQNMLTKGTSQEDATREIETLLSLLDATHKASLRLVREPRQLRLDLGLNWKRDR